MKKSKLVLSWNIDLDCPHCNHTMSLSDLDDDGWLSTPIFNNRWDDLVDVDVRCTKCKKFFEIGSVET